MFQRDYLMRMIAELIDAVIRSIKRQYPDAKAAIQGIEGEIGRVTDSDHNLLLSMAPDSMVAYLDLGHFQADSAEYVVRSLYYLSDLYAKQGDHSSANLRALQADKLSARYQLGIDASSASADQLEKFFASPDDPSVEPDPQLSASSSQAD
ncbi:MAG: hypothetical protein LBL67_00585 [Coriobacteriales bacterium]|jgi:hypothetical protein|nr:hypothetical protein [Coriobacteriales bacterium]